MKAKQDVSDNYYGYYDTEGVFTGINTYEELMTKLPLSTVNQVEDLLLSQLITQNTLGQHTGDKVVDFVTLHRDLTDFDFLSKDASALKETINVFAEIAGTLPDLHRAVGAKVPRKSATLFTDVVTRAKIEFLNTNYHKIRSLFPDDKGRMLRIGRALNKALQNPLNQKTVKAYFDEVQQDPELIAAVNKYQLEWIEHKTQMKNVTPPVYRAKNGAVYTGPKAGRVQEPSSIPDWTIMRQSQLKGFTGRQHPSIATLDEGDIRRLQRIGFEAIEFRDGQLIQLSDWKPSRGLRPKR